MREVEPGRVSQVYDRKNSRDFAKLLDSPRYFIGTVFAGVFIGLSILIAAVVLSVSSRYSAFEAQADESAWVLDRMTGNIYKCRAADYGKASCEPQSTGSVDRKP